MVKAKEGLGYPLTETPAQNFFTYQRFGFREVFNDNGQHLGWSKTFLGEDGAEQEIIFRKLTRKHVQAVGGQSAFDLIVDKHKTVFNIKRERSLLSTTDLVTLDEEGGSVIVASKGRPLFADTLLGFSVAHGSRGDTQTSKLTAVVEEAREARVGLYLKLFQACVAAEYGYTTLRWRMDATKGRNASRFFGLGAKVMDFAMNYFGDSPFQPGSGPSDRLNLVWDLNSPDVHRLIEDTINAPKGKDKREYPSQSFRKILDFPRVQAESAQPDQASYNGLALTSINGHPLSEEMMVDRNLNTMLYEIPANIDLLPKKRQRDARDRVRTVFSKTIDHREYREADVKVKNSGDVDEIFIPGNYFISDFITCFDGQGNRRNFYVLTKKSSLG